MSVASIPAHMIFLLSWLKKSGNTKIIDQNHHFLEVRDKPSLKAEFAATNCTSSCLRPLLNVTSSLIISAGNSQSINYLIHLMITLRYLMLTAVITLLMSSCAPKQNSAKSPADMAYKTTQPSLLFFKNMRSSHYRSAEEPGSRITVYRLNRWQNLANPAQVWEAAIASDWLNDRAFLLPEWTGRQPVKLTYTNSGGTVQQIALPGPAPTVQTDWVLDLATLVEKGTDIRAYYEGEHTSLLFPDAASKACFQTVVADYLRLTERN